MDSRLSGSLSVYMQFRMCSMETSSMGTVTNFDCLTLMMGVMISIA